MKKEECRKGNLKFEEMEEVEEFSLGGLGIGALIVTTVAIFTQIFMQLL